MPKKYDLFLKGDVGYWNFNADMVNYVLDKHKDSEVHVLIDSLGGDVATAFSISSLFKIHGNVHVHYVGMNASAATIASMGAKHISIDAGALYLVHKCLSLVFEWDYMNADELDAHIAELQKLKSDQDVIDGCIAGMYARRCKKSKDELLDLMKTGGWLTPEQALEWGFVDEITDNDEDRKAVITESVVNMLASAGIPVPTVALPERKRSLIDRFLSLLNLSSSNQAADTEAAANQSPIMAKLTAIAALLGCSLSMSDDKLSLSDEQASKVNDTLDENKKTIDGLNSTIAERDKTIEDLKASIAEKEKTIADLKKEPATPTSEIKEDKKTEEDKYAPVSEQDAIAASKAFLGYN